MIERTSDLQSLESVEHGRQPNIHPGQVLREEYLTRFCLAGHNLAKAIMVDQTLVSEILNGKRGITADTAWRLARFFGTSAEMWMNLQIRYDLLETEDRIRDTILSIRPLEEIIEEIEDEMDVAEAEKRLADPDRTLIDFEDLKAELGY